MSEEEKQNLADQRAEFARLIKELVAIPVQLNLTARVMAVIGGHKHAIQ